MLKLINDEPVMVSEGILHHQEGVDILPGNIELSGLEISLIGVISRETILRQYVNKAREFYDYIIIDCMPSLGMLTINEHLPSFLLYPFDKSRREKYIVLVAINHSRFIGQNELVYNHKLFGYGSNNAFCL